MTPATIPAIFANGIRAHQAGNLREAEQAYRQVLSVDPRHADSLNLLGVIACDAGHDDVGIDLIGKAIAANPKVAVYHFNQAVALQDRARLDEAIARYRSAIILQPDHPVAHNNLGNALKAQNKVDEAIASYRKAFQLKPDFQQARNNLGNALRSQGRFGEAAAVYEDALKWGSDVGPAYYGLSTSRKFTASDRPLIAAMRTALDDPELSDENRSLMSFALGKIFDDLAEYETAIGYFDTANRIERGPRGFDRAGFTAAIDWLIASFSQHTLQSPAASPSELPILIMGMPRSGTTLVEQILASHPHVAGGGELPFWIDRLEQVQTDEVGQFDAAAEQGWVRDYLGILRGVSPAASRVTDKMPYNFLALGFLYRAFPKAHVIHCRRRPIDTALSVYLTRLAGAHDFSHDRGDVVYYTREYTRLMDHWRTVLPPDRVLDIDYEELVADPEAVSRRMIAFTGLPWNSGCLDFHKTDRPIVTASAWQARQPVYRSSAERWRNYEPWLGELRVLLTQSDATENSFSKPGLIP